MAMAFTMRGALRAAALALLLAAPAAATAMAGTAVDTDWEWRALLNVKRADCEPVFAESFSADGSRLTLTGECTGRKRRAFGILSAEIVLVPSGRRFDRCDSGVVRFPKAAPTELACTLDVPDIP